MHTTKDGGLQLSPKASFILGLVGGVLVLCTIGFFVLLGIMLGGDGKVADAKPSPAAPAAPSAPTAPPADEGPGEIKPIGDADHWTGPEDADVTMIVYTDIECPFCSRFHPSMAQVQEELGDSVRVAVRHFPLSFHQNARGAANAAECAGEQDMFFEYLDELFSNQASLGTSFYKKAASDLGLNTSKFNDCLDSQKYDSKVTADFQSGIAAGVKGTPGSLLIPKGGEAELVPGAIPYDQLKAMIQSML